MNTTEHILLIILAAALALFLLVSIIAAIMAIRLVQSLRRISASAEKIVHSAESVSDIIKNTANNISIFRFVKNVADMVALRKPKEK